MDRSPIAHRSERADRPFHVLIVGGGISGTLAAAVLGRAGYDVGLIDLHETYPRDFRAEHLDGAMIEMLVRLKVLDNLTFNLFRGETVTLARNGRVVGTAGTINFGLRYETMVNRARKALPANVRLVAGRVSSINTSEDLQRVCLSDGTTLTGRLLILATGQSYGLCKQVGIQRRILREAHSLTFGFEIKPAGPEPFPDSFLVYQREHIQDRIDYLAAFTLSGRTRVNLFTYRNYKEPWAKAFIADPDAGLRQVVPRLEEAIGAYTATAPVEARPVDLYVSENVILNGVVLIGDAFQASCPATGMGMVRLLTDIEQLCQLHLPRWLETPGMGATKIASFYQDPVKQACDAKALHDSKYRHAVSTDTSLAWRLHRARVGIMERIQGSRNQLSTAANPRIAKHNPSPSLVAS